MKAEYILDYNIVAVERSHNLYMMARIKAGAAPQDKPRRPLNLSVVLDRSGSMGGNKLDYVKEAARFLIQNLTASDKVSVVSYNDEVSVNSPPASVTHKDQLIQAIQLLKARGSTNLSGGWLQGCQFVMENHDEKQVNRVILLTDGLANRGITDSSKLAKLARQKREEGVTTTTMGVGMDFNEDLLTSMASEGGGAFYFIDEPDQTPHIFKEELRDLLNVVGQNLVIQLTLSPEVQMVRQLNTYSTEQHHPGEVAFRLGDIYAEETKTLMLELSIPALQELGEFEVARLRFDYDEVEGEKTAHHSVEFPIVVNAVTAENAQLPPNREVLKNSLLLKAASAREKAVKHADRQQFKEAREILTEAADEIETAGIDDIELQREHDMLREEAVDMELGEQRYDAYSRKSHISKTFYTTHGRNSGETIALHRRMKSFRPAVERKGDTPEVVRWKNNQLELNQESITIGRDSQNMIVLNDDHVSRKHCTLQRKGDDLWLIDLNSDNGTFANGGRISDPFRLSVGDVVTVGETLFRFENKEKKAE